MKSKTGESLKSKKVIAQLFSSSSRSISNEFFRISYIKNKLNIFRWVLAVSKKKFKTAPSRNLQKRHIREILKNVAKPGYDVAIFVSEKCTKVTFEQLQCSLIKLMYAIM